MYFKIIIERNFKHVYSHPKGFCCQFVCMQYIAHKTSWGWYDNFCCWAERKEFFSALAAKEIKKSQSVIIIVYNVNLSLYSEGEKVSAEALNFKNGQWHCLKFYGFTV